MPRWYESFEAAAFGKGSRHAVEYIVECDRVETLHGQLNWSQRIRAVNLRSISRQSCRGVFQAIGTEIQQRQSRRRARQVAVVQEISCANTNLEVIGGKVSSVELQRPSDRAMPYPVAGEFEQPVVILQRPFIEHSRTRLNRLCCGSSHCARAAGRYRHRA